MSVTSDLIDAIADSVAGNVAGALGWRINKFRPYWMDPTDTPALAVYPTSKSRTDQWTGSHMTEIDVSVTYYEDAREDWATLVRDESLFRGVLDAEEALMMWVDSHQQIAGAWKLDWLASRYPDEEAPVPGVVYVTLELRATVTSSLT